MEKKVNLGKSTNGQIEFLNEISKGDLENYTESVNELIKLNKSTWPFLIAQKNYFLFMEETIEDFNGLNFLKHIPWEFMEEKTIQSNRRLYNFISSFVSFTDHAKTYLNRNYGENSEELKEFKIESSFNFDNCFGYRFFCKLRDYIIHCGMPMGNISLISERNEKKGIYENTVILKFGKEELLKNFPKKKWGNIVGPELELKEDFFSVSNLVYDTMVCIKKLNKIL